MISVLSGRRKMRRIRVMKMGEAPRGKRQGCVLVSAEIGLAFWPGPAPPTPLPVQTSRCQDFLAKD